MATSSYFLPNFYLGFYRFTSQGVINYMILCNFSFKQQVSKNLGRKAISTFPTRPIFSMNTISYTASSDWPTPALTTEFRFPRSHLAPQPMPISCLEGHTRGATFPSHSGSLYSSPNQQHSTLQSLSPS